MLLVGCTAWVEWVPYLSVMCAGGDQRNQTRFKCAEFNMTRARVVRTFRARRYCVLRTLSERQRVVSFKFLGQLCNQSQNQSRLQKHKYYNCEVTDGILQSTFELIHRSCDRKKYHSKYSVAILSLMEAHLVKSYSPRREVLCSGLFLKLLHFAVNRSPVATVLVCHEWLYRFSPKLAPHPF